MPIFISFLHLCLDVHGFILPSLVVTNNFARFHARGKKRKCRYWYHEYTGRHSLMWNVLDSRLKSRCIPQVPLYILLSHRQSIKHLLCREYVSDLRAARLVCIGSHPCISPRYYSPSPIRFLLLTTRYLNNKMNLNASHLGVHKLSALR